MLIRTSKISKIWNFKSFKIEKELFKIAKKKSSIHVDSYKEIDKYLKKAYPKDLWKKSEVTFEVKE